LVPASEFKVVAPIDEVAITDFNEIFLRASGVGLEELREN